jgi:hypothetical protein
VHPVYTRCASLVHGAQLALAGLRVLWLVG